MLVVSIFLVASLVGCSQEGDSTTSNNDSTNTQDAAQETQETQDTTDATDEATEQDTQDAESSEAEYAVILKTQASDFWVKMKDGVLAKADELGVKVDVYAAQSEEDTEGQLKILENTVNSGYKAIGVAPLSPVNLIPGIVQANEKGIYVMNIDEKVEMEQLTAMGGSVIAFATTDNVKVGEKGATYIVENVEAGSKVAIIEGKAGNASGEARREGAYSAFEAAGLELVGSLPGDWDRQKALDVATSFIQQNPDLKGIYACNDTMALGALQAVINAGKVGEIMVVGTDGDTEARDSVDQGMLAATVAQDPAAIGAASLEAMVKAVEEGGEISPNVEPEMIPIDSQLITK